MSDVVDLSHGPPAVILNMYATGLGIARNLAQHGVRVYGLSVQTGAPGNYSRRCHPLACPDSAEEPERLLAFLMDLAVTLQDRPILFPTRDADIRFLDQNRADLSVCYRMLPPEGDSLDAIMNKHRLAEAARAAGIPTPRTHRIGSRAELRDALPAIRYPVVAKPVYAQDWRKQEVADCVGRRKAVRIGNTRELEGFFSAIERVHPDLLLQEWVDGPDDHCHVLGAYRGRDDRWLGWFTARKLLQYPPGFGLGCMVRLTARPDVEFLGKRLLEALAFRGVAEVEFKEDPATKELRLIEVNPRFWDQHALGLSCGVDLATLVYRDLCFEDHVESVPPRSSDGMWISGSGLLGSLVEDLRHARVQPYKLLMPLRPGTRFSIWDPDDPGPFWGRRIGRTQQGGQA